MRTYPVRTENPVFVQTVTDGFTGLRGCPFFFIYRTNEYYTFHCTKKMLYAQLIASHIRDYTSTHEGQPSVDVRDVLSFVRARQHSESPMWFHRCKDRSGDVPRREWLHERFLPPDYRVPKVAEVLNCTHVLQRHAPPVDCTSMSTARAIYDGEGYTSEAYRRRPELFDAFYSSSFPCMLLAELIENQTVPVTVRISNKLVVQKGLEHDVVRVQKPYGCLSDHVVVDRSSVPSGPVPFAREASVRAPGDVRLLECRWNLSATCKIDTYLFVQETIETLAIPFKLERDPETDTFWLRVFMLEVTVSPNDGGEFTDKLVVNPWYLFLKSQLFVWRSLMETDLPNVAVLHSHGCVDSSEAQTATIPGMEINLRDSWHVSEPQHFTERPRTAAMASNFSTGVVWCMDMPDYPEAITDRSQIQLTSPEVPFFTRDTLLSLIRCTRERHLAHMLSRGDKFVVSTGTTYGHVSCTYGPAADILVLYVTTCYKVGIHYRIGHIAMVTRDVERARAFIERHLLPDRRWIQEDIFLALATRACRLCTSTNLFLSPIPVGRVLFQDEYTTACIHKGTWKLAGCGCIPCVSARNEPMLGVY